MNGKQTIQLAYGTHRINYATSFPILLSVNDEPLEAVQPGSGRVVLRKFSGTLQLDPTEPKKPFKFAVTSNLSQPGETVDQAPPPQPTPPSSYLAKVRQQVRNSMGLMREEFDRGPTIYETGDVNLFEEDLVSKQKIAGTVEDTGSDPSDTAEGSQQTGDNQQKDEPGNPG